jgi:bifunctional non-homologous end joining protein LigD
MPEGAVKAELPATLTPELATLVDGAPPDPDEWIYEIKFDGYRMLTRVEGKDIRLVTRNGKDWTDKLLPLQKEIRRMKLPDGWYDGEIVVHDEHGKPNFNLLQLAFDGSNAPRSSTSCSTPLFQGPRPARSPARRAPSAAAGGAGGQAVRRRALFERVRHRPGPAGGGGLPDRAGRRDRQAPRFALRDAALAGLDQAEMRPAPGIRDRRLHRPARGSRTGIGALLLGYYDEEGVLRYAGHVGSGFNGASLRHLREVLEQSETTTNPFPPRAVPGRGKHWVKPALVAEVSFSEWTPAG